MTNFDTRYQTLDLSTWDLDLVLKWDPVRDPITLYLISVLSWIIHNICSLGRKNDWMIHNICSLGWFNQHQASVGAAWPQWGEHNLLWDVLERHVHTHGNSFTIIIVVIIVGISSCKMYWNDLYNTYPIPKVQMMKWRWNDGVEHSLNIGQALGWMERFIGAIGWRQT